MIPDFDEDGLLPTGDYAVSFRELRQSILVAGPADRQDSWDANWRGNLLENLEVLTRQLWTVGITEVYG